MTYAAVLEVEDDGPGIPHEDRERVFERFYRRNQQVAGSGLGLAIVQHQGGYEVIPREAALKIQERDPRRIVQLNILVEPKTPEEDDPYAAYQIPDDLMW